MPPWRRLRGKLLGYALICLATGSSIEGLSYLAGKYLQDRKVFYRPAAGDDYVGYLRRRDAVLGWPSPAAYGTGEYDVTGARFSPAFHDPHQDAACVSLYGDSFVWGLEVDAEHAWGNVLARMLRCRVANYGVNGYGTDQAYLRYRGNPHDRAGLVVLGIMPENISRNLSQFRDLIGPKEYYSLKPRFVLGESDELELIPLPEIPVSAYDDFVDRPQLYLEHDYFRPGGPSRVSHLHFPYSLAVARAFGYLVVHKLIRGEHLVDLVYADLYRQDHPSQALPLMVEITAAFRDECAARGAMFLVIVLPDQFSLAAYQRGKQWVYQSLLSELANRGIPVLNFGDQIAEALGDADAAGLFEPLGHYGEEANRRVAECLLDYCRGAGWLSVGADDSSPSWFSAR